ncbi:hypothetical protein GEMRC1_003696 [Eukaryota sp. GEM-RC1]
MKLSTDSLQSEAELLEQKLELIRKQRTLQNETVSQKKRRDGNFWSSSHKRTGIKDHNAFVSDYETRRSARKSSKQDTSHTQPLPSSQTVPVTTEPSTSTGVSCSTSPPPDTDQVEDYSPSVDPADDMWIPPWGVTEVTPDEGKVVEVALGTHSPPPPIDVEQLNKDIDAAIKSQPFIVAPAVTVKKNSYFERLKPVPKS